MFVYITRSSTLTSLLALANGHVMHSRLFSVMYFTNVERINQHRPTYKLTDDKTVGLKCAIEIEWPRGSGERIPPPEADTFLLMNS